MTTPVRRRCLATLVALLAGSGVSRGQLLTPNTSIVVPPVGHARAETEYSLYAADSFAGLDGHEQRFPGSLDFTLAVLRVSYSPLRNLAIGVEQPYRRSAFDEPGIEASFSSKGIPGIGFFVDWAPRGDRTHRWRPVLRFGYFRARNETDRVLTISDGANRYSAALSLDAPAGPEGSGWRGGGTFQVLYGPPLEAERRFLESRVQVEAGRPVLHVLGSELCAFGLLGYRSSTSARQEGMFLHDRTSQGAFAGLRLDWKVPARTMIPGLRLSVVKDLRPRNALSGWRTTLSLAATF
ncbi:MAG: hypothetical protein EPN53_14455 [Acidobacteria bacterium]|nr:MAG: hypothetical protein EPN53_14455 [Acidobacteriota bacterium]